MNKITTNQVFLFGIAFAGILWAILFYLDPDGIQRNIFNKPLDTLFSDFNCVRTNSVEGYFGTSQESKDLCYAALGPTMSLLFPFTQRGAAAFTIVGSVLWIMSLAAMFPIKKIPIAFIVGCALSQIFIHAFQWGNQIIYAAAGVMLFFAWSESHNVWKRRAAALGLAVGAVLKITPGIFSFLYFMRWLSSSDVEERKLVLSDFIFFFVSSVILFFVPFSWYGGIEGFFKWMSNAAENADYYIGFGAWGTVPVGRTIRILLKVPDVVQSNGVVARYSGIGIERAFSAAIGLVCFARAAILSFRCKNNSSAMKDVSPRILLLLVGAMLLIPGNMHTYTGLYLLPVLIFQLRRALSIFEAVCWFLFLNPIQIPVGGGCVNHPVANFAFLALLCGEFFQGKGQSVLKQD